MEQEQPPPVRRVAKVLALLIAGRSAMRRRPPDSPPAGPPPSSDRGGPGDVDPSERELPSSPRSERLVAALLTLAAVFGFCFTAVYVINGTNTQLLGVAMGGALALIGAAAIIAGKQVVPQEIHVEERDELLEEQEVSEIVEMLAEGGEGVTRRGLLIGAGCLAGAGLATAAVTPIASLGPRLRTIHSTPWKRGVRLLDDLGRPYSAEGIEIGALYVAFAEGADKESLGAALNVMKLPRHYMDLPPRRAHWAPHGILAYTRICPHAGCAVSEYRYPTFAATSVPEPALTCPCHYSTFAVGDGGRVIFGPAGRALSQLPIMIDSQGNLRASHGFYEDVGPAWFGTYRNET